MININDLAQTVQILVSMVNLIVLLVGFLKIKDKIEVIHKATNSMKDELVQEVRTASIAQGVLQEKDRERP